MEIRELKNIVLSGHERTGVDFKCSKPWDGEFKYKMIKAVLAFANAGGGYIVIGVDESVGEDDGRFSGISDNDRSTWDVTKVNRDINNFAGPGIDINLSDIPLDEEGTRFLVLEIPTHGAAPHVCIRDKHDSNQQCLLRKGAVYFRSRNKESKEMSEPDDWKELIKRCVISRREELLRDFQQILQGSAGTVSSETQVDIVDADEFARFAKEAAKFKPVDLEVPVYMEILCYSLQPRTPVDIDSVKTALKSACVDYRGWPFLFFFRNSRWNPMYGDNQVSAVANESPFGIPKMCYWAFDYSGGIFYSRQLTTDCEFKKPEQIDPELLVKLVAEAIIAMGRLYDSLGIGLDKLLKFVIRLSSVRGAKISSLNELNRHIYPSEAYAGDMVTVIAKRPVVDFTTKAPGIAA